MKTYIIFAIAFVLGALAMFFCPNIEISKSQNIKRVETMITGNKSPAKISKVAQNAKTLEQIIAENK